MNSKLYAVLGFGIICLLLVRSPNEDQEIVTPPKQLQINVVMDSVHSEDCEHGYTVKDHFPCSN